ncbi:MAG TPA: AMP-binding protein [Mycobacteriales bacterium]
MIGLRDLTVRDARSWSEAAARFTLPAIDSYNIAADCLRAPRDSTALLTGGPEGITRVSFGELDAASARFAAGLRSLGLSPGDRVAIMLSQSFEMAVAVFAVLRAGAVAVPVSTVLGADAVRHRLTDSQPRIMVAAGSEAERALAAEAGVTLVSTGDGPGPTMAGLLAGASVPDTTIAQTAPDTPGLLLYTSGTTGKSKGVLHGHRVLLGHHGVDRALNLIQPDDVSYSPVDWAWAGGLLLGLLVPLAHGIPVVAFREHRFDAARTVNLLRDTGVSVGLFPPTMLRLLRQSGELTGAVAAGLRLRCLVTGAEAVEPDLLGWAADELGVVVNNAYGQTEANALIGHSTSLGVLDQSCLGRPYPGHRVSVLDERMRPVPVGESGQVAVAADDPVCMIGYWNAPEVTGRKITDGWLLTGDTAHADEQGQLYFHGRSDDIIKSGGYRIGPAEIEAVILSHPSVAECAVVGLPDPVRGHAVTAFVRLRDGAEGTDALTAELQHQVRTTVGAHAYPRVARYVPDLPRTSTGKVDRASLRRRFGTEPADSPVQKGLR